MSIAKYRHHGCRIIDELIYKGMKTLYLENELIRVGVLVDKGADIFEFVHKPTDTSFLWESPVGLIDPRKMTPTIANSSGAFLDSYHGGWQEIFPGGGPVNYRGADLGLHGEVTHLGWDSEILIDSPEEISVKFMVNCLRTPFQIERTLRLISNQPTLFIQEKITNKSPADQEFMWGHHPAFGAPFLKPGLSLIIPAKTGVVHSPRFAPNGMLDPAAEFQWPIAGSINNTIDLSNIPGREAGNSELIYLKELTGGWYAILDTKNKIGFGLAWELEIFRYLWFWSVYGKFPGYPWWDLVYCIALEPWTSMPNNLSDAIKANTQMKIKGGDSITTNLCATALQGYSSIKEIQTDGTVLSTIND
jgi:hypothetical protein